MLVIRTHQLAFMKMYRGQEGPHILTGTQASTTEEEKKNSIAQLVNSLE